MRSSLKSKSAVKVGVHSVKALRARSHSYVVRSEVLMVVL